MKKYKLMKSAIFAGIASLVFTTTGCGINNTLKDRYVAVVDGEVKLLEEEKTIGGALFSYKDIITNEKYFENSKEFEDIEIKGSLVQFLSSEQINAINGKDKYGDEFNDNDWIELETSISNKYREKWNLNTTSEEFSVQEVDTFLDEYNALISSDNLYIVDTSLCEINNKSEYELDRYYLIMKNDNPINNSWFDKERILFNSNFDNFYFSLYENNDDTYYLHLSMEDEENSIYLSDNAGKQAAFNINEFFDKEDISGKRSKYSILELEELMKNLNKKEVEKIKSDRIYVFDATKSDIDIIPFYSNGDLSSFEISDYYILIQDENSNKFDTLSNNDDNFSYEGIYIDNNVLRISINRFMFASEVDTSYNFMNINTFLTSVGLGEYIANDYSDLELTKINSSLNQIRIRNMSRGLLR